MGVSRLREFIANNKVLFDKAFFVVQFLCFLHLKNNTHISTVVLTSGPSMLPTLNITADLLLAERLSHRFGKVEPGDIVLVRSPVAPRKVVTKRVIGMEGHSMTYVVDPNSSDRCETIVVPKGHLWVQGDNIYASTDSRRFGPVPYGLLEGKVFWRIWPPKDFGPLEKELDK
ncbi:mitochondrial inner membrane protease subunit 1-like [Tripterygium wilfordii]|uniref:Mitochondrial inner membrane protease subunit 1-like n=1 Tax=Tripterygium wilfordii TaxID=458696 RepID=A0A7J7CQH3_TRIWF|nr:mitochondrial inner membrane protease subunit 1-like [Tripterygium wilfordii]XP_038722489.1 mitochondrial inner membrane protease subunit 1-like [Tripterygium wilfordii]XP_038722490.1 mitochondrial inner membrane protease subunit 1-like [Tripterygium wilfordii]XP_038722492.1 mitochondrial inner membrane protease subunit 1-like [Tripterygium wilfordii]XP_038722493.1 mitochondrial inner membrane protease subunit 1-like [Tripterygium wilfordii]KAF5736311.1 mitochondrial inner membrane protease